MRVELKKKVVSVLKNATEKQIFGAMNDNKGGYCALGVLEKKLTERQFEEVLRYELDGKFDLCSEIVSMNDHHKMPFSLIAGVLNEVL